MENGMVDLTVENVFPDGPSSNPTQPNKAMIRRYFKQFETAVDAGLSNGGLIYDTKAHMDADLAHPANASAWVMYGDDAGIYRKSGASGSGSWTWTAPLPYSFIKASNVGAGTVDAIQATTLIPVPATDGAALITVPIVATNTVSPVTVSFNGGDYLTIKTMAGFDVGVGGLASGMMVVGLKIGSTFRLLTDNVASTIVAAMEAQVALATTQADRSETQADRSETQATNAAAEASAAQASAESAQNLVEAATAGFTGYPDGNAYDFGYVTDATTYFDTDWGSIAA
jgi:hypothetical protein